MTGSFELEMPPKVLRDHQVRTLPALRAAIEDLLREAHESGHRGPIDLADFDPTHGVNVALTRGGDGRLFISFRRRRR